MLHKAEIGICINCKLWAKFLISKYLQAKINFTSDVVITFLPRKVVKNVNVEKYKYWWKILNIIYNRLV